MIGRYKYIYASDFGYLNTFHGSALKKELSKLQRNYFNWNINLNL